MLKENQIKDEIGRRIWNELYFVKYNSLCLNLFARKYQKRENMINIILALTSSTSIVAWTVWNLIPYL